MKIKIGYYKKKFCIDIEDKKTQQHFEYSSLEEIKNIKVNGKVDIVLEYSIYKVTINKFPNMRKTMIDTYLINYIRNNYPEYCIFYRLINKINDYNSVVAFLVKKEIFDTLKKCFPKARIICIFDEDYLNVLKKYNTNVYIKDNELIFCINKELFYCTNNVAEQVDKIVDYITRGLYDQLYNGKVYIFSNKESYKLSKLLFEKLINHLEEKVELIEMCL